MLTLAAMRLRWRVRCALLLRTARAGGALRCGLCGRRARRRLKVKTRGGTGQGERCLARLAQAWRVLKAFECCSCCRVLGSLLGVPWGYVGVSCPVRGAGWHCAVRREAEGRGPIGGHVVGDERPARRRLAMGRAGDEGRSNLDVGAGRRRR